MVMLASNIIRLARHLLIKHQIQSRKLIALIEKEEEKKKKDEDIT
jgi:hypothetical protein